MSMINDALRRAKAAQDKAAPIQQPTPQFRSPDLGAPAPNRSLLPFFVCAVILVGTIAFSAIIISRATRQRTDIDRLAEKVAAVDTALPVQARGATSPSEEKKAVNETVSKPQTDPASTTNAADSEVATTNAILAAAPPKPPEPRLQAVFYSPQHPSAMIDGKSYCVGDKLGQFKVKAIDAQSATLVSTERTNVLTLP